MTMYHSLLVPLDGSPFSAHAVPIAIEIARRTGAEIHLAFVLDPSTYIPFVPGEVTIPVYDADLLKGQRDRDQAVLDAQVAAIKLQGVRAQAHLVEGIVAEVLAELAVTLNADLTVMSTHGRGGFTRLRLGSVAAAYLTRATAPILLVRSADEVTPPPLPTGTLLCALDASPFAEGIVAHATTFAAVLQMRLALMSVAIPQTLPMSPFGTELLADVNALDSEELRLADYLTGMLPRCPVGTTIRVSTGVTAARAILDEADAIHAGAIAIATHGRGGIVRLFLGSVADELLRHAPLPILVYRPDESAK